ncbi:unnamed protein product [Caenorhabditis angaria]|uniref:7TM GPCR serpentine receptor class x (Srx) domain-containing protein n=1 Tax=Caenorhabditis angaria TaxID=860376 RepID=A0A9P1ITF8_9PELO|nr:unnamed protein product [Caenorhabditis angaria]
MLSDVVYRKTTNWAYGSADVKAASFTIIPYVISVIVLIIALQGTTKVDVLNKARLGHLVKNQIVHRSLSCFITASFYIAVLLNIETIVDSQKISGIIFTILQFVNTFSYFATVFERYCCLVRRYYHPYLINNQLLLKYLGFGWGFSIVYTLFFSFLFECDSQFYHYGWILTDIPNTTCPKVYFTPFHWIHFIVGFIAFIMISDIFIAINFKNAFLANTSLVNRRRETNQAKLVAIQGLVLMIYGLFYLLAKRFFPDESLEEWAIFWTFTFSYSLFHLVDSVILFFYKSDLINKTTILTPVNSVSRNY